MPVTAVSRSDPAGGISAGSLSGAAGSFAGSAGNTSPEAATGDELLSRVASLTAHVDALLAGRALAAHAHLANQMHRSAMEALASLSNGWEAVAPLCRMERERALIALYELQLYTRMAAQTASPASSRLTAIAGEISAGIESLRRLLGLHGGSVC